jgi:hypothetical protein
MNRLLTRGLRPLFLVHVTLATPSSLQPTPAAPNRGPDAAERKTGSNGQATNGAKATARPATNGHRRNRTSRRVPLEVPR